MNRQELSREKLLSKLFSSIKAFTYSCCSEEMECRRHIEMENFENYRSKYGIERFTFENSVLVLPKPSIADGGTQPFSGKIGRLRYFALAILAAVSPVSREVVHLSMDLPSPNEGKYNSFKRAPIVYPLLCGHVLTHTVSAICGIIGFERALSDSKWNPNHFIHSLKSSVSSNTDTFADCLQIIKLGFLARLLQALLGYLSQFDFDTSQGKGEQFFESKVVRLLEELGKSVTIESGREISVWESICFSVIKNALASRFPQLRSIIFHSQTHSIVKTNITNFFHEACYRARDEALNFLCSATLILQVLIPGSESVIEKHARRDKTKRDDNVENVLHVFFGDSIEKQFSSGFVVHILEHWYSSSVPNKIETLSTSTRIGFKVCFKVGDWPLARRRKNLKIQANSRKVVPLLGSNDMTQRKSSDRRKIEALPISYTDLYAELCQSSSFESTAVCLVCGEVRGFSIVLLYPFLK